jgi:hypothetical protein
MSDRQSTDPALAGFRRLQARLAGVWSLVHGGEAETHTAVVVPSLSFDPTELAKIEGVSFYEERLLFTLMRLRDPRARVIYVTSQPIHPEIVDYYLQLLTGIPAAHAKRRLHMLCLYDASPKSLTAKILERPRVIERLRGWIGGSKTAYLTCFNVTPLERDLALAIDVPLNGVDPELLDLGTKSGARRVFRQAGVELPEGVEDLRDRRDLVDGLMQLSWVRPGLAAAVVKLNDSFAGEGNAVYRYPKSLPADRGARREAIEAVLGELEWSGAGEPVEIFLSKLAQMGGICEERIEGSEFHSPSVQMRIDPHGEAVVISSHEQVLGGSTGQAFMGCRFPARAEYRHELHSRAQRIASVLRGHGVVSRFAIDFVAARGPGEDWRFYAIEINLRMGGTTHPFMALQFLTGGGLDKESGEFVTPGGQRKYYFATDHLKSPTYEGLLPEDFLEILTSCGLHFQPSTETGVLFHMIGAVSQFGKLGLTCIGNSPQEADELYVRTVEILNRETGGRQEGSPQLSLFFDRNVPMIE